MDHIALLPIADSRPVANCEFTVVVDGRPAVTVTTPPAGLAIVNVFESTHELTITATPSDADLWPMTARLRRLGPMHYDLANASVNVEPPRIIQLGSSTAVGLRFHLSRLKDVTESMLAAVQNVPVRRRSIVSQGQEPQAFAETVPTAHFMMEPLAPGAHRLGKSHLGAVRRNVPMNLNSKVYELRGEDAPDSPAAPKLLAAAWPAQLPAGSRPGSRNPSPAPLGFVVCYHPTVAQVSKEGYYVDEDVPPRPAGVAGAPVVGRRAGDDQPKKPADPRSWDYLYYQLWEDLSYRNDPLLGDPYSKGYAFQAAAAGKGVVTVVPANRLGAKPEVGRFVDAEYVASVLADLQRDVYFSAGLYRPPSDLGGVAFACFSHGVRLIKEFLNSERNGSHALYTDKLVELYLLDPSVGDDLARTVDAALAWQRTGAAAEKVIRAYAQANREPWRRIRAAARGRNTVVLANAMTWGDLVAEARAVTRRHAHVAIARETGDLWAGAHQRTSAMMLTPALARSGFANR